MLDLYRSVALVMVYRVFSNQHCALHGKRRYPAILATDLLCGCGRRGRYIHATLGSGGVHVGDVAVVRGSGVCRASRRCPLLVHVVDVGARCNVSIRDGPYDTWRDVGRQLCLCPSTIFPFRTGSALPAAVVRAMRRAVLTAQCPPVTVGDVSW